MNGQHARQRRARQLFRARLPIRSDDADDGLDRSRFSAGFWTKPHSFDPSPAEAVEQREMREAIMEEIAELPPGPRAVVTLRDMEEWSSEEVCNVLGITETNQRVLLHRARSRLRAALEKRFGRGRSP